MKQCITILLVPIHEPVGRFRYSVFIYEENSWKSTLKLILRTSTCWSIVVIPSSYVTMICWWFGAEISQLRYDRLLCSVISALVFEPRNRRLGEAVARCWYGYGGCQFANVLSWICKWDKQYILLELVWSWPSAIWHIAVFRDFRSCIWTTESTTWRSCSSMLIWVRRMSICKCVFVSMQMGLVVQRSWVGLLVTKYDMACCCVPWFPLLDLNHGIDDLEKL